MATINTILTITDKISTQLNLISGSVNNIKSSFEGLDGGVSDAEETLNNFNWDGFASKAEAFGQKMSDVGTKMTLALTAPLVLLGKKLYSSATDYESAFTDVRKTTKATDEEFEALYSSLLNISEMKPVSFLDLSGIGYSGSQMGVPYAELEQFIGVAADLQAATDIAGEEGVKSMARFFNVTEKSTSNIGRFGGAIVELGNNFAATENEILNMATSMAPTAALNNWDVPQILAISAAMVSMGINAEAGGTSAGKFMDQMSLASEVGLGAMNRIMALDDYGFTGVFDVQKMLEAKDGAQTLADGLNVTKEQLERMVNGWADLEYFARISNKSAEQFQTDWKNNPAQGMLDFFTGLNKLDQSGMQSAIASLDEMGITEIRLARMVKGITGNTALYSDALAMAEAAYAEDPLYNALTREAAQRYGTQESQNDMLGNKLQNSMADLGSNLVTAMQPALDTVNDILDAFNNLSEVDQTRIIKVMGALAVTGPVLTGLGKVISAVGSLSKLVSNAPQWGPKLVDFFTGPAGWVAAGTGAVVGLVTYLESIPTTTERIISSLTDIQINIDQTSLNQAKADIESVQQMVDLLAGGAVTDEMERLSAAVQMGYGTSSMYNKSLAYEAEKVQADVQRITTTYAAQIYDAEQQIINAASDVERNAGLALANSLKASMDAELIASRGAYAQTISSLFNGMFTEISKQYPEMAGKIEQAASQYNILSSLLAMPEYDNVGEAAFRAYQDKIFDMAKNAGYLDKMDMGYASSMTSIGNPAMFMTNLRERIEADLRDSLVGMSDNPILADLFARILDNQAITENLDLTGLQGALDGVTKALDFAQAGQQALANGDANLYGQYLVLGLADGITANASQINSGFEAVRNAAVTALQTAFLMQSPSRLMAAQGIYIPQGLAQGILAGTSAVISAAISMARAGIRAAKAELGIASPSKIFEEIGAFTGKGFALGISSTAAMVGQAVETMTYSASESVWGLIDVFNDLEHQDMLGDGKELKVSDTDLRRIRDLAERQAINRFTTAELKVEFTANNTINSDLDLDGIVSHLETVVEDTLMAAAEGVYA